MLEGQEHFEQNLPSPTPAVPATAPGVFAALVFAALELCSTPADRPPDLVAPAPPPPPPSPLSGVAEW